MNFHCEFLSLKGVILVFKFRFYFIVKTHLSSSEFFTKIYKIFVNFAEFFAKFSEKMLNLSQKFKGQRWQMFMQVALKPCKG